MSKNDSKQFFGKRLIESIYGTCVCIVEQQKKKKNVPTSFHPGIMLWIILKLQEVQSTRIMQ